ncbi:BTB/POZ domain-containing protein 9-like [Adelges cooleyi]|uniref:BTB/POZ domain-containing protein 9-like n=1 Tax=Adelges cooleyi TaxID=133065 RepID=UPI0021800321|nr:BTB/POZ domain-containing protein 9-like [Adelges cooleyi]
MATYQAEIEVLRKRFSADKDRVLRELWFTLCARWLSDVDLVLDGKPLPAHRIVLAARSTHFRKTLFEDLIKFNETKMTINDIPGNTFRILHEYIYTGRIRYSALEGTDVSELLRASDLLGFPNIKYSLPQVENIKKNSKMEINHAEFLIKDISNLYLSIEFSDVLLEVEGEKINAHRVVLAARCEYFRRAFSGFLVEANQSVMTINEVPGNAVFELIRIADLLLILELKYTLCVYLETVIEVRNDALLEILNSDSFYANELVIFRAVCRWIKKNQNNLDPETKIQILSAVRYPLMSNEELSEARNTLGSKLADAVQCRNKSSSDKPKFRGQLNNNLNLVELSQIFTDTNEINGSATVMELNTLSFINYIEIILGDVNGSDIKPKFYSYYIEVSIDASEWTLVIDHSNYNCRSIQQLWIEPQVVRYIRIVGANSTANVSFVILNVNYNTTGMEMVKIKNGLVGKKTNKFLMTILMSLQNLTMRL